MLLILAAASVLVSVTTWDVIGWWAILPFYFASSFIFLSGTYACSSPKLLGKRVNGGRTVLGFLLFAPYFLLNTVAFGLYRRLSNEQAFVQVLPNLYFGRWLSSEEYQDWTLVVDLACEFTAPVSVRSRSGYRSLPVLDATPPTFEELQLVVNWIAQSVVDGKVYVHCALGHGRSACVVIAYLLNIGVVTSVKEGVLHLTALRPGVRLHPSQRQILSRLVQETSATRKHHVD
ncbi:MAG: dual specificity protein phosphatase family protein [Zavarzinella sp.]